MTDNTAHKGVLYEQIALDYFLQHIFPQQDHYYNMILYKESISKLSWDFSLLESDFESNKDAYERDESAEIPDLNGTLLVASVPVDDITEDDGLIEYNLDDIFVEVFTRLKLKNGHYLVQVELRRYPFIDKFYLEINQADNEVVKYFFRRIRTF